MDNPIKDILARRQSGRACGIASYCTGNEYVIEAALLRSKNTDKPVLIEATANQVNQFGGYTGLLPADFRDKVMKMADRIGLDRNKIILGGDHLGPLLWSGETENEAMAKAHELVYQYVRAGYTKIHLDTSMKLADDPDGLLSTETIARRGVELYKTCMKAYEQLLTENPDAVRPVFVIGSEVPIPGGAQEAENSLSVTKPDAFEDTIKTYSKLFADAGIPDAMDDVIAVVVQPGVEFGDDQVFYYDREKAKNLCDAAKKYSSFCFEGHSTDYQKPINLKEMVEDGIAILKVGPALTFGLREALFALSYIERELVPEEQRANLIETLEQAMLSNPKDWVRHYHGEEKELYLKRKFSLSDRCRYYMANEKVCAAIEKLFENLRKAVIPAGMLHQYMPLTYDDVRCGRIGTDPKEFALSGVFHYMEEYEQATF